LPVGIHQYGIAPDSIVRITVVLQTTLLRSRVPGFRAWMVLALLGLFAPAFGAVAPDQSFLAVERQVESLQHAVVDPTVAIRIGGVSGSGAIISPDGYVLTAGHVTE